MSLHFDEVQAAVRGCVGDQPQQATFSEKFQRVGGTCTRTFLRLVSDTAALQFLLPTPVK